MGDIGEDLYFCFKPLDTIEQSLPISVLASKYIVHKDRRPASWENHTYLIDPVNDLFPRIVVRKSAQLGVPLDINTPIPTIDGWKALGNIEIGDRIFNENGNVCSVIYVSPIYTGRNCYKITFSDGSTIISDKVHLWTVTDEKNYKYKKQVTISTEEIRNTFKHRIIRNRYAIDVQKPLNLPEKKLLLDPYLLGLWLGDGHSDGFRLTAHVDDANNYDRILKNRGHDFIIRANDKRCINNRNIKINGYWGHWKHGGGVLKLLNVLKNKHIPKEYLRASYQQRLDLLCGLMDTDGSITKDGSCEFSNSNKELIENVYELLMTLGIKARLTNRGLNKRGFGGNIHRKAKPIFLYRIYFKVYEDIPVFKLKRKLQRIPSRINRRTSETERRRIIDVCDVDSVPVRCIAINSDSHLYLAGKSMIPTHNTTAHGWKSICLSRRYGSRIAQQISFPAAKDAETYSQVRFAEIINNSPEIARLVLLTDQSKTQKQVFQARVKIINGCAIYFQGRSGEKQAISIDTNVVFIDERDFDKNESIIAMLEGRVGHDFVFKTDDTKGLICHYSTPSMPGFGIDKMYDDSDQRHFFVTCTRCNYEYVNEFNDKCIEGFYVKGEEPYEGDIYWRCPKCKRRLDIVEVGAWDISRPLESRYCKWVPMKPENTNKMHGYYMGKPSCAFRWVSPKELLLKRDGPIYKKYENKFYNQELGLPHMGSNQTISVEILHKNIKPDIKFEKIAANTIMGCDQGCWIVVVQKIYGSESESYPDGRYKVIHIEHIHEDEAFDTVSGSERGESREGLVSQRIREYGANIVVMDDQPNSAVARRLANKFSGSYYRQYGVKVWRLVSSKINQTKTYIFNQDDYEVAENRTKSLDETYAWISNLEVVFPDKGGLIQTIDTKFYKMQSWDMVDLCFDHICKETKISKAPDQIPEEHISMIMKGRSFGNYVTIGDKQNHLLHALKMVRIGIEIKKLFGNIEIVLPYVAAREFFMK